MSRFSAIFAGCAAVAAISVMPVAAASDAANYPNKPIRIVVPFPPGGTTDTLVRLIAPGLQKELGQTVVVENRGGAAATIGADAVAKSAPDGYTLLVGSTHHTIAPNVIPKLPYAFDKDFSAISMLALVPNIVMVNAKVPANTVQELVAVTLADPEKYSYASAGPGSVHHLIGEMFKVETGAQLLHVPYKGSGPAVVDLLGGQVAVMFDTATSALPHIRSGKTRALAVTTANRSSALPDLPTLAESGLPGFDQGTWFGLMAPRGTPEAIVTRLNALVVELLQDPAMQQQLQAQGIEPMSSTPAEMQARIDHEMAAFSALSERVQLTSE